MRGATRGGTRRVGCKFSAYILSLFGVTWLAADQYAA